MRDNKSWVGWRVNFEVIDEFDGKVLHKMKRWRMNDFEKELNYILKKYK
jgi:hypothetical protein